MRGNTTDNFGGFSWADEYSATISIAINWGDNTGVDVQSSTGTINAMYSTPTYTAFVNPSHLYVHAGAYTVSIHLTDSFNNQADSSVSVTVYQGPSLNGAYASGGRAPMSI